MEQSCELCTDIRGRSGASNVIKQSRMSPFRRQAANFFEMCIDFGTVQVVHFESS